MVSKLLFFFPTVSPLNFPIHLNIYGDFPRWKNSSCYTALQPYRGLAHHLMRPIFSLFFIFSYLNRNRLLILFFEYKN